MIAGSSGVSEIPRNVGQVPVCYNHEPTGRLCEVASKYNSRYRDLTECGPQHDFAVDPGVIDVYAVNNSTADGKQSVTVECRRLDALVTLDGQLTAESDVVTAGTTAHAGRRRERQAAMLSEPSSRVHVPRRTCGRDH